MSAQTAAAFVVLAGTVAALVLTRWRPDLVALGVLLILGLGGLVTLDEALSGFGSPAVAALAGVFVISAGLERTGAGGRLGRRMETLARSERGLVVLLMAATGVLAAFMINLTAVAVLLPVATAIAHRRKLSPSRLLLPMAYAAVFGGKLTVIAGPSNLIVADLLAERHAMTLRLFDLLPLGLPLLLVGTLWMATVGSRPLPPHLPRGALRSRRSIAQLLELYRLSERLFEARVIADSPVRGKTIEHSELSRRYGLMVVEVVRDGRRLPFPQKDLVLQAEDRLVLQGRLDELDRSDAFAGLGLELSRSAGVSLDPGGGIVEAVVAPHSALAGRTVIESDFRSRHGLNVLGVWREGRPIRSRLGTISLQAGDGLLIQGPPKSLQALRQSPDLFVLEEELVGGVRAEKMTFALLSVGVLLVLTLIGVPVALAAVTAAALMIASGVLTPEEAYQAVDWRSIVLIGGMLPLAVVLQKTGAAALLAQSVIDGVGKQPWMALAGVILFGTIIGHFVPPVIVTVLLAPIALDLATGFGVSALPFAMATLAAAGLTIVTPFSNPVTLIVMSPGGYTSRDYLRTGLPLAALLFVVMLIVIPLAFPF